MQTRLQGARWQMAGTSMRNVMSQAAILLVSSFIKGSYDKPKGLPKGSSLAHRVVMQQINDHAMKPIVIELRRSEVQWFICQVV